MLRPVFFLYLAAAVVQATDITGAALHRDTLITWGRELKSWRLSDLAARTLPAPPTERGEGGCIVDEDTPRWGVLLQEGIPYGNLILRRAPRFDAEVIDTNSQMHDCVAATIFGHAGLLVLHNFEQLRFYERPDQPSRRWPYSELYSIYTPSRQGGLLVGDLGIIAGNYWLRRPAEPGIPWREFALNTWHETPDSSTMRFASIGEDLIVAQGHIAEARLARFSPPTDITQLWNELRLGEELHLRYPHALASDNKSMFVVGENAGPGSRLFLFRDRGRPELIATTGGTLAAFIINGRVLTIGPGRVEWYTLSATPERSEDKHRSRSANPHAGAKTGRSR